MNPSTLSFLFFVLFVMAIIWLVMVWHLFRRLARQHAGKYEEMGRPSLFLNNNFRTNFRFLKFLLTREPERLADEALTFQVNVMRAWFAVYLVGFAAMSWMVTHQQGL